MSCPSATFGTRKEYWCYLLTRSLCDSCTSERDPSNPSTIELSSPSKAFLQYSTFGIRPRSQMQISRTLIYHGRVSHLASLYKCWSLIYKRHSHDVQKLIRAWMHKWWCQRYSLKLEETPAKSEDDQTIVTQTTSMNELYNSACAKATDPSPILRSAIDGTTISGMFWLQMTLPVRSIQPRTLHFVMQPLPWWLYVHNTSILLQSRIFDRH